MIIDLKTNKELSPTIIELTEVDLEKFRVFDSGQWSMNWREPFWTEDCKVFGMFTNIISIRLEGLAAFVPDEGSLLMFQLETARHNQYDSLERVYKGVGKHLTAFGCRLSKEMFEITNGALSAYSKKQARRFYESLNAREAYFNDSWYFNAELAQSLIDECL